MPISPATGVEETRSSTAAADRGARCQWCDESLDAISERLPGRVVCGRCGAASTDPPPSEEELDRAYSSWYRPEGGRFSGPLDAILRRSRGRLAARLDRIAPAGTILDVGAGDGTLLDALAERGRTAIGIERRSERPDIREGELADFEGPFAAIVFWHSLEHLRVSGATLDAAASLLGPGGALVIAMPNAASVQARVFGDRWFGLDLATHLVHVPTRALLDRLSQAGLSVERVSWLRGGQVVFGWLHGLVGLVPGRPDLYDAIRRRPARSRPLSGPKRAIALAAAAVLLPVAVAGTLFEAALGRGGTAYVEARRV